MFLRKSSSLPSDPEFPADLEKLGYYVNEKDQIRSIEKPDQEFHYFISKNERVLEKQREAMDSCVRNDLAPRFEAAGLHTTRLPQNAGPTDPHIPILTTSNLPTAERVILYLGENNQDLGIFAYRTVGQEGLAIGSCLNFAAAALGKDTSGGSNEKEGNTALVTGNLGQLIWHRRGGKAISIRSWDALPRKSGVGAAYRLDSVKNRVPGHENVTAHVTSVFSFLDATIASGATVDVIGVGEGAEEAVRFLDANWTDKHAQNGYNTPTPPIKSAQNAKIHGWEGRISALALAMGYLHPMRSEIQTDSFKAFVASRARFYLIHPDNLEAELTGRSITGCNVYSAGEPHHTECIMPKAFPSILAFLKRCRDGSGYEEAWDGREDEDEGAERPVANWIRGEDDAKPSITVGVTPKERWEEVGKAEEEGEEGREG